MIRHEVILRMKAEITREMIDRTLGEVREQILNIEGVERVLFGVNNALAYRHVMFVVEVADTETLDRFSHGQPYAKAIRKLTRMAESSAVGSYLVGSKRHSS
jgi:hypothetical protein